MKLIQLKRAARQPKDLEAIVEMQALLNERQRGQPSMLIARTHRERRGLRL